MYRLMLYFLAVLWFYLFILFTLQLIPASPILFLFWSIYLLILVNIVNQLLAKFFKAIPNTESASITGLILALIFTPFTIKQTLILATLLTTVSIGSKYFLTYKKRHIFNPAGIAVAVSGLLGYGASWWVGNIYTVALITAGGILVLAKIRRWWSAVSFILVYTLFLLVQAYALDTQAVYLTTTNFLYSPILFFAFVMLIEPVSSPVHKRNQIVYGVLVAASIFLYQNVFKTTYDTFTLALLTGNLFAFFANKQIRTIMHFVKKKKEAHSIMTFQFLPETSFHFVPGQYMEWTLPHPNPDQRGLRRFFTISSSPTEKFIAITTKFPPKGKQTSTFKQALKALKQSRSMQAFGPDGNFVLPDKKQKLAFIAGGIGVTPFRSIVKYLLDTGERWNIILLYSASKKSEFVFKDVFEKAQKQGWLKVNYLTKRIDEEEIKKGVKDWQQRIFYVSGPEPMVRGVSKILQAMGVKEIRHDYFPGYT